MRAPKDRVAERNAYEFFVKCDAQDRPVWTREIEERGARLRAYRALLSIMFWISNFGFRVSRRVLGSGSAGLGSDIPQRKIRLAI
jgi:hypothetical protein